MKNTIIGTVLLGVLSVSAQAQITAGTTLVSGGIGYYQNNDSRALGNTSTPELVAKDQQFNVSPVGAYFIADNLALGFNLNYAANTNTRYFYTVAVPVSGIGPESMVLIGETTQEGRSIQVGPMARYYKFLGEKTAFFGQLGAGYQHSRQEEVSTSVSGPFTRNVLTTGSGFYAQLTPGFAYFPIPKFALELTMRGLSYLNQSQEARQTYTDVLLTPGLLEGLTAESSYRGFAADFGLSSLQLGASIYLGRK
jgi:hypothetical protein